MRIVIWAALLMMNMQYTPYACQEFNIDEDQRKVGHLEGNFTIGALFSIRYKSESNTGQKFRCGKIRDQYGMQRVEAALWTIKKINSGRNILPNNYSLGIHIKDTCWDSRLALRQALQFVDYCPSKSDQIDEASVRSLIGVIGPPSSEETEPVQNLLRIFSIPQIGFSATAAVLGDKNKYEFFTSVVPSDANQALAMLDILKKFGWTYVNAVGSEGLYGSSGLRIFNEMASSRGVCIQKSVQLRHKPSDADFDDILTTFRMSNKSKVIICFCEGESVIALLQAARRAKESHKYVFIGSDGWAGRDDIVKDIKEEAAGNLMIRINSSPVEDFKNYYFNMSQRILRNHSGNPWLGDFYQEKFNCTLNPTQNGKKCNGNEWLQSDYTEDPKLSFIVKSIYLLAYALGKFLRDCLKNETASNCTDFQNADKKSFLENYINKTEFTYQNETINMKKDGGPLASYEILNYQYFNGSYQYRAVGRWLNNNLTLEMDEIQLPGNVPSIKSVCSDQCHSGQTKVILNNSQPCCWECQDCGKNEFLKGDKCKPCLNDEKPNKDHSGCVPKAIEYTIWWETKILICVSISATGILVSISSAAIFYKFRKTPVVKFSFKELSFIMYSGMILAYGSTYWILATPTVFNCYLVRYMPGLSLTMIYGPLLVKINRVSRIFSMSKKRFPKLRPKYMSTTFQILACIVFIIVELSICAIYSIIYEPDLKTHMDEKIRYECESSVADIASAILLNAILLVFCTVYAFKTRSLPDNFNEAKFIAFSCYATAITWGAFLLIYQGSSLKVVSMSLVLSTSSLIIQMCLFVPKLYIILLRPEKNCRANFITSKDLRMHVGSIDSTYGSERFIRNRRSNGVDLNSSSEDKKMNSISRMAAQSDNSEKL